MKAAIKQLGAKDSLVDFMKETNELNKQKQQKEKEQAAAKQEEQKKKEESQKHAEDIPSME